MSKRNPELYRDLESRLYQFTPDQLKSMCQKLNMTGYKNYTRPELVASILDTAEDFSKKKFKGKSEEEIKNACWSLIESVIAVVGDSAVNIALQAQVEASSMQDEFANKMKLKNIKDHCFCGQKGGKRDNGLWITCINQECGAKFHHECLPWRMSDLQSFECPSCIILNNDPLNDVIQILYDPSILISDYQYQFKVSVDQYAKMTEDVNIGLEVRSIKLDGEHFFEQTWPDRGAIKLNSKVVKEVKPLHQNSSLKKRRDEKLFNRQNVKVGFNSLSINYQNVVDGKNTKLKQDPKYVFAVVLVRKILVEELSMRIRNINRLSVEESKEFIKEKFLHNKDLEINEIKVNLIDNISFTHIKYPARGLYCDHVPCFSLDYFLLSMENNFTRKWACPICKKRCNKLIVDSYLEMIIEQAKKKNPDLENVFFLKNGDVVFKSDIIDEAEEKRKLDESNAAKIKALQKKPEKASTIEPQIPDDVLEVLSVTSEEDNKFQSAKKTFNKKSQIHEPSTIQDSTKRGSTAKKPSLSNAKEFSSIKKINLADAEKLITNIPIQTVPSNTLNFQDMSWDEGSPKSRNYSGKGLLSPRIEEENPLREEQMSQERDAIREETVEQNIEEAQESISKSSSEKTSPDKADIRYADKEPRLSESEESQSAEKIDEIFENVEKRDEPVIDKIVNQKLQKDEDLKQDREFLAKLWNQFQKLSKEISELPFTNHAEYFENMPKKLNKERFISKLIDLLSDFTANRYQSIYSESKPAICKRYKQLSLKLAEVEKFYPETNSVTDNTCYLVKRAPRSTKSDSELFNSLLAGYNLLDSKTPQILSLKKKKRDL